MKRYHLFLIFGLLFPEMILPASVKARTKEYEQKIRAASTQEKEHLSEQEEANERFFDAAKKLDISMLRYFLRETIYAHAKNKDGRTALSLVVSQKETKPKFESNKIKAIELLLSKNADVNSVDNKGKTPLMYSALAGDLNALGLLIKHKANINAQDKNGETALMYATQTGNATIIVYLLDAGADKSLRNKDGKTALDFANEDTIDLFF